jgi:LysM repeat protein
MGLIAYRSINAELQIVAGEGITLVPKADGAMTAEVRPIPLTMGQTSEPIAVDKPVRISILGQFQIQGGKEMVHEIAQITAEKNPAGDLAITEQTLDKDGGTTVAVDYRLNEARLESEVKLTTPLVPVLKLARTADGRLTVTSNYSKSDIIINIFDASITDAQTARVRARAAYLFRPIESRPSPTAEAVAQRLTVAQIELKKATAALEGAKAEAIAGLEAARTRAEADVARLRAELEQAWEKELAVPFQLKATPVRPGYNVGNLISEQLKGVPVDELLAANPSWGGDPNHTFTGAETVTVRTGAKRFTYPVQEETSLKAVTATLLGNVSTEQLVAANPALNSDSVLQPGQELVIDRNAPVTAEVVAKILIVAQRELAKSTAALEGAEAGAVDGLEVARMQATADVASLEGDLNRAWDREDAVTFQLKVTPASPGYNVGDLVSGPLQGVPVNELLAANPSWGGDPSHAFTDVETVTVTTGVRKFTYPVQEERSLKAVAVTLKDIVSVEQLVAANPGLSPDAVLQPGQELAVDRDAQVTAKVPASVTKLSEREFALNRPSGPQASGFAIQGANGQIERAVFVTGDDRFNESETREYNPDSPVVAISPNGNPLFNQQKPVGDLLIRDGQVILRLPEGATDLTVVALDLAMKPVSQFEQDYNDPAAWSTINSVQVWRKGSTPSDVQPKFDRFVTGINLPKSMKEFRQIMARSPEPMAIIIVGTKEGGSGRYADQAMTEAGKPVANKAAAYDILNQHRNDGTVISYLRQLANYPTGYPWMSFGRGAADGRKWDEAVHILWPDSKGVRDPILTTVILAEVDEYNQLKPDFMSRKDDAMGGIDFNATKAMTATGDQVDFKFDPAMLERFRQGDFNGITPIITNVIPIQGWAPILGSAAIKEEEPKA